MNAPLNTRAVGYSGAGLSITTGLLALNTLLTDPTYLLNLYLVLRGSSDPTHAVPKLCAAAFALALGVVFSYLGRPVTVPDASPSTVEPSSAPK